jgi:AsmA protein
MDLLKTDRLLGLGGLNLDFSASGSSQAAIMRSLDGSGSFDIADGAIKGVNFAKLVRSVMEIQQSGLNPAALSNAIAVAQRPDEQTDFSEFLSRFAIDDGLVNAATISLTGPFLTMTGTGAIDLPGQTLDLRLSPRASTAMDSQGGKSLAIPMRVTGDFSQPTITIDIEALLKGRAEQGLRDVIEGALGGKKDEAAPTGEEPAEPATPEEAARSLLKGLIGPAPAEPGADDAAEPPPDSDGQAAAETSPEKALAKDAVNRIFGTRPKPEPAPEEQTEDQPK